MKSRNCSGAFTASRARSPARMKVPALDCRSCRSSCTRIQASYGWKASSARAAASSLPLRRAVRTCPQTKSALRMATSPVAGLRRHTSRRPCIGCLHSPVPARESRTFLKPKHPRRLPRRLVRDRAFFGLTITPTWRHYVTRILGGSYEVLAVPDGRAALEAALSAPPDLVLSDVMMPGLDGFGLLKALRADERTRQLPVILLSARAGEEASVEGLDAGADDYLVKPFSARELKARVRAHLKLARQRRGLERELEQRVQARTAEVARLTGVLQMLSGINTALVRIQNRDEVMAEACRLAHGIGGYALAMVALINPTTRMARPVGWAGYEFLSNPEAEFPVADHERRDSSLMGRVMRTGEATLCEDIERFPYVINGRDQLIAAGVQSLACLPLRVDNTPVGAFLFGRRSDVIGPDELLLLEEVASNLSFALQYLDKQDAVHFLSYFEPLTGLAKRALFCERLSRLLTRGTESLPRLAVTVFDIAHLSVINDSFGRHAGDRLLLFIADRLNARFPDTERLAPMR